MVETNTNSIFKSEQETWVRPGFDALAEINTRNGALVEVAGPVDNGYLLVDTGKLTKKLYVSNGESGNSVAGEIDFCADPRHLPFKNESLGALFVSCMPQGDWQQFFVNAYRVLEPKGLVVWQGGTDEDTLAAKKAGLEIAQYYKDDIKSIGQIWNVIFQKK